MEERFGLRDEKRNERREVLVEVVDFGDQHAQNDHRVILQQLVNFGIA